jgi:hypothetical protein
VLFAIPEGKHQYPASYVKGQKAAFFHTACPTINTVSVNQSGRSPDPFIDHKFRRHKKILAARMRRGSQSEVNLR